MVTFAAKYECSYEDCQTEIFYAFNISNSSNQTIFYNLTSLNSASGDKNGQVIWTANNSSGSLNPAQNVTVLCTVQCNNGGAGESGVAQGMFQAGAAPLLTLGGQQLQFWFWTSGVNTANQLINICDTDSFSITENTDAQNNATGNGFNIGLGGGGGALTTDNICIQVFDEGTSY